MEGDKLIILIERNGKRYQLVEDGDSSCEECAFKRDLSEGRCPKDYHGACLCYLCSSPYGVWREVRKMSEEDIIYEYATQAKYGEYWLTLGEDSESLSQTKEKIKILRSLNPQREWRIVRRQVATTWKEVKE